LNIYYKLFYVLSVLFIIGCSNSKEKQKHDSFVIYKETSGPFNINEFIENPFRDQIKVPSILSDNIDFMETDKYKDFQKSEKTIHSANGDYQSYIYKGSIYEVAFSSVGAEGGKRKMLRTILATDKKGIELKAGIRIGSNIDEIKKVLPEGIGEYTDNVGHYFYVLGEETSIHFYDKNGLLVKVVIQLGD
jgi:hypothetical protein